MSVHWRENPKAKIKKSCVTKMPIFTEDFEMHTAWSEKEIWGLSLYI